MAVSPQPVSSLQIILGALALPKSWRSGAGPALAAVVLVTIVLAAVFAPLIAPHDPMAMDALQRLKGPSETYPLGTDAYGRDLFSRVITGGRISLFIGIGAAVVSVLIGLMIGLVSGFFRLADAIIMRIMDSLMAIPAILLAIALVALNGPSIWSVIIAITIPEIPRVVRLVRSVVLSAREEP
jgi:peptide/nickel transport system permease protein